MIKAAQYIRMSTEHQRYSPGHQAAAISAYAETRGYELVVTYADLGVSGLKFSSRPGLQGLVADVLGGAAPYATILVYDVSRWGRFQDPDQGAHYEFLCREAGVNVEYCAEAFDNDGSASSTILKLLKRVMAAEYSRELSAKVLRAQLRLAAMGYKMGGPASYGLRRLLVDKDGQPVVVLGRGERNALRSNRVLLVPGTDEEIATIRRIYRLFLYSGLRITSIVRLLNREGTPYEGEQPWTHYGVSRILTQEKYAGVLVFNKTTQRLGRRSATNPAADWVRVDDALPAIVDRPVFDRVQDQFERRKYMSDEVMLDRLRRLRKDEGRLTIRSINACATTPATSTYVHRFGSLAHAFELIGYVPDKFQRAYIPTEELLSDLRQILAEHGRLDTKLILATPWAKTPGTYAERFGSLRKAYTLIGYSPSDHQRGPLTNEAMIALLADTYKRHGSLSARMLLATPGLPLAQTYRRRFGSFEEACALVGFKTRRRPRTARPEGWSKKSTT